MPFTRSFITLAFIHVVVIFVCQIHFVRSFLKVQKVFDFREEIIQRLKPRFLITLPERNALKRMLWKIYGDFLLFSLPFTLEPLLLFPNGEQLNVKINSQQIVFILNLKRNSAMLLVRYWRVGLSLDLWFGKRSKWSFLINFVSYRILCQIFWGKWFCEGAHRDGT